MLVIGLRGKMIVVTIFVYVVRIQKTWEIQRLDNAYIVLIMIIMMKNISCILYSTVQCTQCYPASLYTVLMYRVVPMVLLSPLLTLHTPCCTTPNTTTEDNTSPLVNTNISTPVLHDHNIITKWRMISEVCNSDEDLFCVSVQRQ